MRKKGKGKTLLIISATKSHPKSMYFRKRIKQI